MGMSVTISAATEQDAEQIFRLQYLCFQSEAALYGNYRIAPLVQSLDSVREEVAEDCVFVARLGEEVVGSVRGRVT
ncbi:GNAT family N-acetyltransferase, partial [Streptomyces sp. SID5998]|nr:GNAT family N-acetyltransferase [Streptomyces sp. SID5998]